MKKFNLSNTFLGSIFCFVLFVSMFVGTTYAWFVDSVASNNNIIQSGVLDVELEYMNDNGKWQTVREGTNIFGDGYWEPGHTTVVYLKVSNVGSLALKYKMDIGAIREILGANKQGGKIALSDYLVSKVIKMGNNFTMFSTRREAIEADGMSVDIKKYSAFDGMLDAGKSEYLAFVVYMPADVDNSANYYGDVAPRIDLGIDLVAIQLNSEYDSFGPDYDKDAEFDKVYGLLIENNKSFNIDDYDFGLLSTKRVDSLVHVKDGAVVDIEGNTNHLISSNSVSSAPVISAEDHSVININGGSYLAKEVPIIDARDGSKINIYRGIFSASAYTDSSVQTNMLFDCDVSSGCEINIYGGTFVNYDPRDTHLGNLVEDGYVVIPTERENGDIWYTVVDEYYKDYTPMFSVDDVMKAFEEGKTEIFFACDVNPTPDTENLMYVNSGEKLYANGYGATITLDGTGTGEGFNDYAYFAFIPKPGKDAEVSDFKFTGEGFVEIGHTGGKGGGVYYAENLVIEDFISTLFIPNNGNKISPAFCHYGTLTLYNCKMTGTTTKKVGYTPYDATFVNGTMTYIEGGEYGNIYFYEHAHVKLNNTKIDTIKSCAMNLVSGGKLLGKLTVGDGAKVGSIELTPPSKYKPSIVIEAGAEVGQVIYNGEQEPTIVIEAGAKVDEIIYKGTSYTLEQWRNRQP